MLDKLCGGHHHNGIFECALCVGANCTNNPSCNTVCTTELERQYCQQPGGVLTADASEAPVPSTAKPKHAAAAAAAIKVVSQRAAAAAPENCTSILNELCHAALEKGAFECGKCVGANCTSTLGCSTICTAADEMQYCNQPPPPPSPPVGYWCNVPYKTCETCNHYTDPPCTSAQRNTTLATCEAACDPGPHPQAYRCLWSGVPGCRCELQPGAGMNQSTCLATCHPSCNT